MTVTNEERRSIAAQLRCIARELRFYQACGEQIEPARFRRVLVEAQEATGTFNLPDTAAVLERYADLIEPEPERTCRAESRYRDDDSSPWPCFACSECGEKLIYRDVVTDYGEESCEMLPYCAGCGAKVVVE